MPTTIALDFRVSPDSSDVGGYEMFVDVTGATNIQLIVPPGYSIPTNGVRMYPLTEDNGVVHPSPEKQAAVTYLEGDNPVYSTIFTGQLPDGFSLTPASGNSPAILVDSDTNQGEYDYLVRIVTPDGEDTFADPGVRNR